MKFAGQIRIPDVDHPGVPAVFLIEVNGKRYAGSRDFVCRGVEPIAEGQGFQATLFLKSKAAQIELLTCFKIQQRKKEVSHSIDRLVQMRSRISLKQLSVV